MISKFKAAVTAGALVAATGSAILIGASNASAVGTPTPWAPGGISQDGNAVGGIAFFDASGHQVTSGSTTTGPFAAYAVGLSKTRTVTWTDTKATLFAWVPVPGQTPDQWGTSTQIGSSTTFPVAAAPAPVNGTALPVNTGATTDASLQTVATQFVQPSTTAGYVNAYEIRMITGAAGHPSSNTYDYADITINTTTNTWTEVFSPDQTGTATTSTLADGGVTSVNQGDSVTLTDTIAPSATGTVQFMNGATAIGSPVTVTGGVATLTTPLTTSGTASLSAVFSPAALSGFGGSTSNALSVAVSHVTTNTSVVVGVNPTTAAAFTPVALTATVTPATAAGSVQFFDGGALIAGSTTAVAAGSATFNYANFAQGTHQITAIFTPTDTASFSVSPASAPVAYVATAPTGPAPDAQTIQTAIAPGSLAITTPYTAANPLVLPNMTLNAGGTELSTTAQFGDGSTDGSIKVVDTNTGSSWTASALSSTLTNATTGVINAQNVGLTGLTGVYTPGNALQAGSVIFTNNPAAAGVAVADAGSLGLGGTAAHVFAAASPGVGTVGIFGALTVNAPSSTIPGTYTGTITFTVA